MILRIPTVTMKKQTNVRLTNEEKRALRMLAGALGLSVSDWTSEMIREKWNEMFPDMEYPDKEGKHKPKAKKGK
jgi:predicted DNA-binding protein